MGIVNAGQLAVYDEIPTGLKTAVEDVILNRNSEATEKLMELAQFVSGTGMRLKQKICLGVKNLWKSGSVMP